MTTTNKNTAKQSFTDWKELIDAQLHRVETAYQEIGRYERQAVEQATSAIDEISQLMKDSLDYTVQLSGQWRKLGNEAVQRGSKFMSAVCSN